MKSNQATESPESLRKYLQVLIPRFFTDHFDPEPLEDDFPDTFHTVMREFTYTYGVTAHELDNKTLKTLGELFSNICETEDSLSNAVATCFLEHLHQVNGLKPLWPYLTDKARKECYA